MESVRDKLAENIHEMWAVNKIEAGWMYAEYRDDYEKYHPCLTPFERLPVAEKRYDIQLAQQTLKYFHSLLSCLLLCHKTLSSSTFSFAIFYDPACIFYTLPLENVSFFPEQSSPWVITYPWINRLLELKA